ncbi:glutaredoxin domain-containing protein [Cryobacterium psychrophilum]|uniref:NrdH-redoxin n=1 Tax=Cryobacterium psychrophilum TaxID=41988 RepID=A0A4Y8KJT2_9MICO|nr:glutaredoxin domain-containing protein [Cryobacterium psychrophilum]TDW26948.1 ribonucleoside-diphosphate reductase class Ib glutaredoxin subunit [Cryobacterium psychrophilum]TFD75348.1 NrdH-redoxin [Cryobacterium psychrophilum]
MNEPLTVYALPNCMQCTMTTRALDAADLPYTVIDLTTDAQATDLMKQFGYTTAPVVIARLVSWSGFRPDWIAKIAALRDHPSLTGE